MKRVLNNTLQLILLVLISTSVTFSTLHSHHPWKWNQTDHHVNTGSQLTRDSSLCPISGYLHTAKVVEHQQLATPEIVAIVVAIHSESQQHDSFTGNITGRSPPFIG